MADKRADQLKEITERLEQGVKDIFTSEMYTKYLLTMSKFHNYSFNNTLLIAMQRPDATLVAGYNAWKNKFNRYVKKGEKGIQIIAPAPVKEREEREKIDKDTGLTVLNESGEPEIEVVERVIPRFRVTTVFDYAQTDGEPLPTLEVNELTARVKDYTLLKEAIEQVSPVPIRFGEIEGNAKGYYSHMDKEICVRADMGESQTIKTMIHEVAHAMLHDSDQMKQRGEEKDQLTKETEAESIAFTVCSALGIDTSDYSFPYVASWASGKELKELKDSMDTIRLTAADFLEKLETAVAERSVERMTAMEYAEKLIADKERDKTVFDNSQRNLIVNFAYKLDDRAATEELANNLAAVVAAENTEEINRLMWEAEEKIESLPDGMIGLSEMHEYGYLKDDVLPLTKEGAREWHRLGERIYPLFQDGTAGDFASQEEIEHHDGIFGIKADAWSAILLEKNEEYLEDEYARPDAALTVISREQALRLFDEGKQIYLIRVSPWPVLVTGREEIERGSDYFQIAKEDLEKDKQKVMENSEKTPVEKLAEDLDNFAFDFDFYHYKDSVEDREQAVEALKEQIQAGDIQPIREWLQVAVEEAEGESAEKAAELITRMDALVKEQKLLSGSEKQFGIYQITARDPEHDYRFMNLDFVKRHGMEVNRADYELVYTEPLTEKDTLEAIYERFNIQRPTDFTGHSLSVSDVVVLNDGKSIKACYVDSIGFAELPDFFKERKMDLKKETILDEQLQEIEIFDKPGLFSNSRLRDEDVPDGLYRYDLRGSDYDPGQPILVEKTVIVNHAASVLMAEELDLGAGGRLELGEEGLNFTGGLLTVREFMEEQEHKKDGLIHGDSDQIAVEGHVGTWYAIDETEVGGEKFFLLEHEEYGDEAACVAVNEQGKLVAEDLWNGFDEDFQDAVKEYFAEKNPTSQKEEQAVPVAEESRTDNAIISKGEFQQVQQLLELDTRTAPSQTTVYPLSGFLRCADCGQNMIRRTVTKNGKKYQYYHCSTYKNGGGCTPHMINSEKLTESVLAAIRHQVTLLVEAEKVLSNAELASGEQIGIKILDSQITALEAELERYSNLKIRLYQDLCDDVVSREEYGEMNTRFAQKIKEAQDKIQEIREKKQEALKHDTLLPTWLEEFKQYEHIKTLERRVVVELIDHIDVHSKTEIEIHFCFEDELHSITEKFMEYQAHHGNEVAEE